MQKGETGAKQLFHWSKGDVGRKHVNPRFGHSITLVGDVLLMFGGYSTSYLSCLSYLYEGKMWREIPIAGTVPRGRCGHCAFSYKGKLYIWSGDSGSGCLDDMWSFNPRSMSWKRVITDNNPTPRAWASCCVVGDWMIMAGGENRYQQGVGKNSYNVFWDQWALHLPTMKWYSMFYENIITPCPRVGHSMVSVGNMVLVFGGAIPAEWYKTAAKKANLSENEGIIPTGDRAAHDDNISVVHAIMPNENLNIDNVQEKTATAAEIANSREPKSFASPQSIEVNGSSNIFQSVEESLGQMGRIVQGKYLINDIWYFFVDENDINGECNNERNNSEAKPDEDGIIPDTESCDMVHPPVARWVKAGFKAPMDIHQKPDEIKNASIIPAPRAFQTMGSGAISKESSNDNLKLALTPVYIYGGISVNGPVSDIWRLDVITRQKLEGVKYGSSGSITKDDSRAYSPFDASVSVVSACFPGLSPTAYEDTEAKRIISACVPNTPYAANINSVPTRQKKIATASGSHSSRPNTTRNNARNITAQTPSNNNNNNEKHLIEQGVASTTIKAERPRLSTRSLATKEGQSRFIEQVISGKSQHGIVSFDILAPRGRYSMAGTIVPAHLKPARISTGLGLYSKVKDVPSSRLNGNSLINRDNIPTNASIFEKTKDRDILIVNGGIGEAEMKNEVAINAETGEPLPYSLLFDTWYIKMPEDAKLAHLQNAVDDNMAATVERNMIVTDVINRTTDSLSDMRYSIADDANSPHKQLDEVINGTGSDSVVKVANRSTDDDAENNKIETNRDYSNASLMDLVNTIQDKLRSVEDFAANSHIEAIKNINNMKRELAIIAANGRVMGINAKNLSRMVADEYDQFVKRVKEITNQVNKSYHEGQQKSAEYFQHNSEQIVRLKELQARIELALSEFEDSVNHTFKMFDMKLVDYADKFNICMNYIDNYDQYQKNVINVFFRKVSQFQNAIEKIKNSIEELFIINMNNLDVELNRVDNELMKKKEVLVSKNAEDLAEAQKIKQGYLDRLNDFSKEIDAFNAKTKQQTDEDDKKFNQIIDGLHRSIFEDHKKQKVDFDNLVNDVQKIIEDKNKETDAVVAEINNILNTSHDNATKARDEVMTHYQEGADKLKAEFQAQISELDGKINDSEKVIEDYKTRIRSTNDEAVDNNNNEVHEYIDKEANEHNISAKNELINKIENLKPKILSILGETNARSDECKGRLETFNKETLESESTFKDEKVRIENKLEDIKKQLDEIKNTLENINEKSNERHFTTNDYNKKFNITLDNYNQMYILGENDTTQEFKKRIEETATIFEPVYEETTKEFEVQKEHIDKVEEKIKELSEPKISTVAVETVQHITELIDANGEQQEKDNAAITKSIESVSNDTTKFNEERINYVDAVKNFAEAQNNTTDDLNNKAGASEGIIATTSDKYAPIIEQEKRIAEQEEALKNNTEYLEEIDKKFKEEVQLVRDSDTSNINDYLAKKDTIEPRIKEETQKAFEEHKADTGAKSGEFNGRIKEIPELTKESNKAIRANERFIKRFDERTIPRMKSNMDGFNEDIDNYEKDIHDTLEGINGFVVKKLARTKQLIENASNVVLNETKAHREGWIQEIRNYFQDNLNKAGDVIEKVDKEIKEHLESLNIPVLLKIQDYGYYNIENGLREVDSSISDINVRLHTFQDDLRRARKATEPTSAISSRAFVSCDNLMKTLVEDAETARFMKLKMKGGDISSVSARNSLKLVKTPSPSTRSPGQMSERSIGSPSTPGK